MFEPVVGALDAITPRVELTRPGRCAFPTRGPSRYFGGDEELARQVAGAITQALDGRGTCRVGVAEGPFAAEIAARQAADGAAHIIPEGATAAFLSPLSVTLLDQAIADPDLIEVFLRLGLRTMGAVAELGSADIVARFGAVGERAHRLAAGLDERPPSTVAPPPDLEVMAELDPPVDRVDHAAFVGKRMADELLDRLDHLGGTCTRVLIAAETEHGEGSVRCWRHEGALTAAAVADRIRWQLEGWVLGHGVTAGISKLIVRPDDLIPAKGRQLGFWGERTEQAERAERAVARIQGLLGPGTVSAPERRGGRSPQEHIVLVPAEAIDLARDSIDGAAPSCPWPGAIPDPAPAWVARSGPIEVVDTDSQPVVVTARGLLSAPPAKMVIGDQVTDVASWAGPWPMEERWWDPSRHRRQARFQMVTTDGVARLLVVEGGRWWVVSTYD